MTPLQMYLLISLDGLCNILSILTVIFGILTLISSIICFETYLIFEKKNIKYIIISFCFFLFFVSVANLIPSTKQMCAILIVPKIVNNEKIQNITNDSLNILEEKTKEWLNNLAKEKK